MSTARGAFGRYSKRGTNARRNWHRKRGCEGLCSATQSPRSSTRSALCGVLRNSTKRSEDCFAQSRGSRATRERLAAVSCSGTHSDRAVTSQRSRSGGSAVSSRASAAAVVRSTKATREDRLFRVWIGLFTRTKAPARMPRNPRRLGLTHRLTDGNPSDANSESPDCTAGRTSDAR